MGFLSICVVNVDTFLTSRIEAKVGRRATSNLGGKGGLRLICNEPQTQTTPSFIFSNYRLSQVPCRKPLLCEAIPIWHPFYAQQLFVIVT